MNRFLPLLLLPWLAACSMASSDLIDTTRHMSCTHDGGTYYLSRSVIKVVVHERQDLKDDTETGGFVMEEVTSRTIQDRRYPYCLDFLRSATADDALIVSRSPELLLRKISSTSDDKSKEIVGTLIKAIFTGISMDPSFGATTRSGNLPSVLGPVKRFETEYDPFDDDQAAVINNALKEYGFCLMVENRKFLQQQRSVDEYCDNPLGGKGRRLEASILRASTAGASDAPRPFTQGVFYRPRLPYNFFIFVKKNRQVRGGWQVRGSSSVLFENDSPMFSVGINRTYFAKRTTTLDFNDGELRDAQIAKGSELKNFVELPLQIVQSATALPTSILQVKIDDSNNRNKLIKAQADLLDAHASYLKSLQSYAAIDAKSPNRSLTQVNYTPLSGDAARSGNALPQEKTAAQSGSYDQCLADCGRDPAQAAYCSSFCMCKAVKCTSGDDLACTNYCAAN